MNNFWRVFKITFTDVIRSKWNIGFFLFFLGLAFALLHFSDNLSKALISILNVVLFIVPLMGAIMGSMYFYNSIDFIDLLLAQPLKRSSVFLGQSMGLSLGIALSYLLGIGIPFLSFGLMESVDIFNFFSLLVSGVFLAVIFTAFSYMIAIFNPDKVKGIGIALLSWLVLSVVYDGLFLIYLMVFSEYPVEKHAIVIALLNPIDLARIMTMLKLDIAALLGYTGAVFKSFFGSYLGLMLSTLAMLFWAVFPFVFISRKGNKRDF